jgi:Flp pilus assembly protein TadD/ketosteroid isomerase-like protein
MQAGALARTLALALGLATLGLATTPAYADGLEDASQLLKSGQHAKALDQINRYLSGKPKDAQGRFLKGIILTGMNKPAEAIVVFQKLSEDYPELPEPYNNLAVIYAQQKQYEKAKQALEMAIRTHPAYATAHENLGDIYSRLASQAYGKALQIDSSNASAQTKLAMISELVGGAKVGAGKTAPGKPAAPDTSAALVAHASTPTPPAPVVVAAAETKPAAEAPTKPALAASVAGKAGEPKPTEAKPADVKPAPVAVKPEPAKAEPAKPAGDLTGEVTAAVDGWLAAWSKKDVKTYLAHYARDFDPPGKQTRKEWEAERAVRVDKPGKIEVTRDRLAIKAEGNDKVTVRFRQSYKSSGFSATSGKTLVLIKNDGKWLILQERVGG